MIKDSDIIKLLTSIGMAVLILSCSDSIKTGIPHSRDYLRLSCEGSGVYEVGTRIYVDIVVEQGELYASEAAWGITSADILPNIEKNSLKQYSFIATTSGVYEILVNGNDAFGNMDSCRIEVSAVKSNNELEAHCFEINDVRVPQIIQLTAVAWGGSPPYSPKWNIVELPRSVSIDDDILEERNEFSVEYSIIQTGYYVYQFQVCDMNSECSGCQVDFESIEGEDLTVTLLWNPPDRSCESLEFIPLCDPTDIDLHVANGMKADSWFNVWDCYYDNCLWNRNECGNYWESREPVLFRDDRNGYGPEVVAIDGVQVNDKYYVGIHRYNNSFDNYPDLEVIVEVSVECYGVVNYVAERIQMNGFEEFLVLGEIEVKENECYFKELASEDGNRIYMTDDESQIKLY